MEAIAEEYESEYSSSFRLLSKKLKETMNAFMEED
jgi:hypothetical protein